MTSRIASFATVVVLGVGTSGAIALAGKTDSAGPKGGAAESQYWPGKGCGDVNHDRLPPSDSCPGQGSDYRGSLGQGDSHGHGHGDNGHGQSQGSGRGH